jgi:uncharacterized membrane protein
MLDYASSLRMMAPMREFHIIAGLLSLLAGAIALWASKGSPLHRRSGSVFVATMLAMTSSAMVITIFLRPNRVNLTAAMLTAYLVLTAWLTVRQPLKQYRGLLVLLMLAALAISTNAMSLALQALQLPRRMIDGAPSQPLFMFWAIGLGAAVLDARLLWAGEIVGKHRLARHLWRMTFAMWIATASFFLGQAKFFPPPLRHMGLLAIPVLLVFATLIYWLVRVLRNRRLPQQAANEPNF